ncbi:MAG: hypothetical protein ABIO02_03560, partial [Patescibacteria group bacterium]
KWQHVTGVNMVYAFEVISLIYIGAITVFGDRKQKDESMICEATAIVLSLICFITAIFMQFATIPTLCIFLITAASHYILFWVTKRPIYTMSATVAAIASIFYFNFELLKVSSKPYIVGMQVLALGVLNYVLAVYFKKNNENKLFFVASAGFCIIVAIALSMSFPLALATIFVTSAVITLSAAYRFEELDTVYFSSILMYLAVYSFSAYFKVQPAFYPLILTAFSFVMYGAASGINEDLRQRFQKSALVAQFLIPLWYYLNGSHYSNSSYNSYNSYKTPDTITQTHELYSLLSGYGAVALFTLDAAVRNTIQGKYFASAIGMLVYIWQMQYVGVTENQLFTLPIALYFFVLAYTRKVLKDEKSRSWFDLLGVLVLIYPTFMQALDVGGVIYSGLLCLEGIILLSLGIQWSYSIYKYAGITAIVLSVYTQTYKYLLYVPKWMITGVLGIGFLCFAIYLLMNRVEEKK